MIDVESLIASIPCDSASETVNQSVCGQYLKYDYIYDQIKEYRREDDPRLNQGIWMREPKKASWNDVKKTCEQALKTKTKDLQIAVWLLEAITVINGFAGFEQGIILLRKLCEKFWDDIYPAIDGENRNLTARMSPFYFLAEKMQNRILLIPLTKSIDGISEDYSLSDWITARHNLRLKNNSGLSLKDIRKSVVATPVEFLEQTANDVQNAFNGLKALDKFLIGICPNDVPSFHGMYDLFSDIQRINMKNILDRKKHVSNETVTNNLNTVNKSIDDDSLNKDSDAHPITQKNDVETLAKPTLEQAYNAISDIATFLEQEQPQSPASTLLKIAKAIGDKTFRELMEIDIKNNSNIINTISELYKILQQEKK